MGSVAYGRELSQFKLLCLETKRPHSLYKILYNFDIIIEVIIQKGQ